MWSIFPKNLIKSCVRRRMRVPGLFGVNVYQLFAVRIRNMSCMSTDLEINRIVWIDLEMTGLDVDKDTIMEIACIITDSNLNIIAEGPNVVIHTPEEQLNSMNEWCINQHKKTGLTDAARTSQTTVEDAESEVLNFVQKHVWQGHSPMAGNSIYMDKMFLSKYMPTLNQYLHYRLIDISTIKEVCRRWNNGLFKTCPKKDYSHRALNDIRESIKELKFYKDNFFKLN